MKKLIILSIAIFMALSCERQGSLDGPSVTGQGGSLARFAISGDHMFAVNGTNLKVFDISDPQKINFLGQENINVNAETLFPRDANTLFIGTTNGMFIYDISRAPQIRQLGMYEHVVSCDPVVANDSNAFVTLRSSIGEFGCNRNVNQLDILDISNLSQPQWLNSFQMEHPIGLGLYGDTLLVCDDGIKIMDISDVNNITTINHYRNIPSVDIIPFGDLMIISTEVGLVQYRYRKGKLQELSNL